MPTLADLSRAGRVVGAALLITGLTIAVNAAPAAGRAGTRAGDPAGTVAGSTATTPRVVAADDPRLSFVGRWGRGYAGGEAATVNSGAYVRLRFEGRSLTGLFDVSTTTVPPEVWVTVDRGPRSLVTVDHDEIALTPPGLRRGVHTVRIDVKDTDQVTNRWLPPLNDAFVVRGFRLDGHGRVLSPPAPAHLRMAFFGDSITEGIRALGDPLTPDGADGTRSWANLTARSFGADFQQVGFGKQGVMRDGVGNVPTAPESFPLNFDGSPADPGFDPDVVVLLQGSNDSAQTDEEFAPAYLDYLRQVRAADPHAWIIAMVPLIGRHLPVIESDVAAMGDPKVVAVDTTGWLDRKSTADYTDTVHPTVAGHLKVAARLVPIINQVTGLRVKSSPVTAAVGPVQQTASERHARTVTCLVRVQQLLDETRRPATGSVVVTAPPGFTLSHGPQHYRVGRDGRTDVRIRLRGAVPTGSAQSTGQVRVLVDGQTEAMPTDLVVTAPGTDR